MGAETKTGERSRNTGFQDIGGTGRFEPQHRSHPSATRVVALPTILHVLAPAEVGGMESVVHLLTRGLVAAGTPVHAHMITLPGHEPSLAAQLREVGVDVHLTAVEGRRYGLERERTRTLCRELGIDVVHSHGYRPDVIDVPAARGLGLPVVSTVHGFTGGGWKNAIYEWLQFRSLRRMDRVLAVSRPLVDLLARRGVPRDAIRLVPNAFAPAEPPLDRTSARRELGLADDDGPVVGWIGRLSREKGPDVLVRAAAASTGGARWVVIGDGPERAAAEELSGALNAPVTFAGMVPAAGRLVNAFDLLVLSSRTEGTPIVALEALAAGVPVVATRVGGVPDLLADGTGVLVDSERPAELAAAVDRLLSDRAGSAEIGERGRQRVEERHAPGPWVERHQALYAEVASGA